MEDERDCWWADDLRDLPWKSWHELTWREKLGEIALAAADAIRDRVDRCRRAVSPGALMGRLRALAGSVAAKAAAPARGPQPAGTNSPSMSR